MTAERRCILVVANETLASPQIVDHILERAGGQGSRVGVVAPILPRHKLDHWFGVDADVERDPINRIEGTTKALSDAGLRATGYVADAEPLDAIKDGIRVFQPDEVVIATHTPERSNWLERGLVDQAKKLTDLPITHLVVDMGALVASALPGGAPADELVRVYRWMSVDEADALNEAGFSEPSGDSDGVLVAEIAGPASGGSEEQVLVSVQVPSSALVGREAARPQWAEGTAYSVPAELLNRANPPTVLRGSTT